MSVLKLFYLLLAIVLAKIECDVENSLYYYDSSTCGIAPTLLKHQKKYLNKSLNDNKIEVENSRIPWAVQVENIDGIICGGVLISHINVMVSQLCIKNISYLPTNQDILSKLIIKLQAPCDNEICNKKNVLKRYPVSIYNPHSFNNTHQNVVILELDEAIYEVPHVCIDFLESNETGNYENELISYNVFYSGNDTMVPHFYSSFYVNYGINNSNNECINSDNPGGKYICIRSDDRNEYSLDKNNLSFSDSVHFKTYQYLQKPFKESTCSSQINTAKTYNEFELTIKFNEGPCLGDSGGSIGKWINYLNETRYMIVGIVNGGISTLCNKLNKIVFVENSFPINIYTNISCFATEINQFISQAI